MKVIAMIDSFKGSATSEELNHAALKGFSGEWKKESIPIADGGEGTMAALFAAYGGSYKTVASVGPLGEERLVSYLLTTIDQKRVAIIECAAIIGIQLLDPTDKTTRQASSYGLGLLIADAINEKVAKIYVTLGGSATTDGGLGLLKALGAEMSNQPTADPNPLLSVSHFSLAKVRRLFAGIELLALADVTNPYTGEEGFATIFGPQKGASPQTVQELEQQAKKVASFVKQKYDLDLNEIAGTGAAGGIGGGIVLLGGQICPGFMTIAKLLKLETRISDASLIITGEGRFDRQTAAGKVPMGVAKIAQSHGIPVVALCGQRESNLGGILPYFAGIFSIQSGPILLKKAMKKSVTLANMTETAQAVAAFYGKIANVNSDGNGSA
ncbi:glycerate kinase [Enterococcus sp.]|uniref:glycerate kinase family protein n=1 Tax=Enterococcus sp. TaxID=35783 RepID=UPI0025B918E1|nr:glycerate kinase [Enterococcus sp.]